MKSISWNKEKDELLKQERGISFEDVLLFIEEKEILDLIENPNQKTYPGQMVYVIEFKEYVYLVPFVETEDKIFLKTIIPSRKATKFYKGKNDV